ncbi:hypothetical protein [Shinella zoogloeoides]|uniref:hypothetical protein n=1 Tax=Shinella TaxID=323620 RepID=UPI0028A65905|nr:hypothetical protein [Shinella zoogloeoides]
MFTASRAVSIPKLSAVLVAAVLAVPVCAQAQQRSGTNVGVGVSLGSVKAGVGATVGGSRGLASANVGASVGGSKGVNAGVNANVAGSRGLVDSNVTASVGGSGGVNARTTATVGGANGLVDANVRAGVGTLDANVDATVGGGSLLDANIGIGTGGGLTPGDRSVIREFAQMPESERMQLVKRCRGVTSGGYDAALVKLCRLLQTASR